MRGLTLLPSRLREGAGEGLFALSYTCEVGLPSPNPSRKREGLQ
jgi:hypothetical protein